MNAMRKTLVAVGLTVGIIVPVSVLSKPDGGYRWPFVREKQSFPRSAKTRLSWLIGAVGILEKMSAENSRDKPVPLSNQQAQRLCEAVKPWQTKRPLVEEDARELFDKISKILTPQQQLEIEKLMGSGPFRGSGRPDLFFTEAQRHKMEAFREIYNPFYPPQGQKGYYDLPVETRQRYADRYTSRHTVFTALARKAKGLKAEPRTP